MEIRPNSDIAQFHSPCADGPGDTVPQTARTTSTDALEAATLPQDAPPIRVLIAAHETIHRESLGVVLQMSHDFEVVASCADLKALLASAQSSKPDVLLLDSGMGKEGGADTLRALKELDSTSKVVLLCSALSREDMIALLRLGARGLVLKSEPTYTLIQCLHKVARGEYWLGDTSVTDLIQELCEGGNGKSKWGNKYGLTAREIEIVEVVLQGCSNREIAASLSLSEHTVKHHLSNIFDKLGVYSRLELALFVVNHSLDCQQ